MKLIKDAEKFLRREKRAAGYVDDVHFQLTAMGDRLPPLSPFNSRHVLDDWQARVIRLISERESVIVSAPTSAGKTVLTTYAIRHDKSKILMVVPTEPLAWQVAAMYQKFTDVALITNQMTYSKILQDPRSWRVAVGTPLGRSNLS